MHETTRRPVPTTGVALRVLFDPMDGTNVPNKRVRKRAAWAVLAASIVCDFWHPLGGAIYAAESHTFSTRDLYIPVELVLICGSRWQHLIVARVKITLLDTLAPCC